MPYPSDTNPRTIRWPLTRSSSITAQLQGTSQGNVIDWPTADPDEVVNMQFALSLNQFTGVVSALDVGSDIAYDVDWMKVYWQFLRGITQTMVTCEQVQACIETSSLVQSAISNTVSNTYLNPVYADVNTTNIYNLRLPPAQSAQPVATPPTGACDDAARNALWAGIRTMVARIDESGRQVLEDIIVASDRAERVSRLIALVPLFGDVLGETLLALVDVVPDILNLYNAHSSEAVLDGIACDLFDMVCTECRYPTYDEVLDYYSQYGLVSLQNIRELAIAAVVDFMIGTGNVAQLTAYFSVNTVQIWMLQLGGRWAGNWGKNTLSVWAKLGEDLPNDNWEVLCGPCSENWCYTFDFTVSDGGWTPIQTSGGPRGQWVAGEGWKPSLTTEGAQRNYTADIRYTAPVNASIWEQIQAIGEIQIGQQDTPVDELRWLYGAVTAEQPLANGPFNAYWTITPSETGLTTLGLTLRVSNRSGSTPNPLGSGVITSITYRGTGPNPFGGNNCT